MKDPEHIKQKNKIRILQLFAWNNSNHASKCRPNIWRTICWLANRRLYKSCLHEQLDQATPNLTKLFQILKKYKNKKYPTLQVKKGYTLTWASWPHGLETSCPLTIFLTCWTFCFFIKSVTFFLRICSSLVTAPPSTSSLVWSLEVFFLVFSRNLWILA